MTNFQRRDQASVELFGAVLTHNDLRQWMTFGW